MVLPEPSKEEIDLARDPALLYRIKLDLDKRLAGEDKNKLTIVVEGATAFSNDPQGGILTGSSSAGKSTVMNQALAYYKKLGIVREFTRITAAAPDRAQENMRNKILFVQELKGIEAAQAKIRVWISEGNLYLWTAEFDKEEKKFKDKTFVTTGIPCFFTTTTSVEPDPELLNRLQILSIDETIKQTDAVLDFKAEDFSGFLPSTERKPDEKIIKMFEEKFNANAVRAERVVIPFARDLKSLFVHRKVEVRRDYSKLCRLIWAVAFLHQYQRPIATPRSEEEKYAETKLLKRFVVALPADLFMAWSIADESMRQTLLGLQARTITVLGCFKGKETVTAKEVSETIDVSQEHARVSLRALENRGYVTCDESTKPFRYSLRRTIEEFEINQLLDLGNLSARFDESGLKSWMESKNADVVFEGMQNLPLNPFEAFVDPITGKIWGISPKTTYEKHALLTKKELSSQKRAESSPASETGNLSRFSGEKEAAE